MQIDDKYRLFSKNRTDQRILDLGYAPGAWSQVARQRSSPNSMILGVDILPCEPPHGVNSIQANILAKRTHDLIRLFFSKHFQLNRHDDLHKDHGYFQNMLEEELTHVKDTELYREIFTSDDIYETPNTNSTPIEREKFPVDVIISDMYEPWPQTTGFWNNITNQAYFRMANTSGVNIRDHYQSIDLCDAALVTAIDLLRPLGSFVCKLYTGEEEDLFKKRMQAVFTNVHKFKPDASRDESKETYYIGLKKKRNVDKLDVFSNS
ncbi:BCE_3a_G0020230.mRNA.1.CDS.1 [Saccharomyces cerevisiae]|nr:BCE_3a_G0020230.mRNA.1.CDS.1 [Saccharomyces cerevisiae]CAI7111045.1 BCE_3a_G0020230.mRNA.1.CDS.1 [Saccharomyces cerevisiae]